MAVLLREWAILVRAHASNPKQRRIAMRPGGHVRKGMAEMRLPSRVEQLSHADARKCAETTRIKRLTQPTMHGAPILVEEPRIPQVGS